MQKLITLIPLFLSTHALFSQSATADSLNKSTDALWNFTASQYYYFIPYDNALMLTGYADHKLLHLEARYNYEDKNTISAFAGWRFEGGRKIQFSLLPMMGVLAGNTNGFAPALEISISYKIFDFYSESEYVIDVKGTNGKETHNNYFYAWRELAITPIKALRTGITAQRLHLYQSKTNVQRGLFAEYTFWKLTAGVYYFKHSPNNNFVITSLSIHIK